MPENNVIMELEEIDIEPEIGLDKELHMQEKYKIIGDFIQLVDERNRDLEDLSLTGLSITKKFIPSVANIIGTDLSNYKIIRKFQFACSLMQVSRDGKIPIAMMEDEAAIMSPAYPMFEVIDHKKLLPAYLMMWFERSEFDREAAYYAIGGIRGNLTWEDFCDMTLPVPSIDKQKEIVKEYKVIQDRIELNNQLIQKLEETAQAIYKEWFVEFEFPNENGKPYKSSGGEMVWCEELGKRIPEGWEVGEIKNVCEKIGSGSTPTGGKESYFSSGISLIRSTNVFDYNFSFDDLAFIDDSQANKLKNAEVIENDILFNITGVSVARCCMVPKNVLPARVNQHVMIIRPFKKKNMSFFLLLNLCSTDSKNILLGISASGSTREAITKSEIEDFKILLPKEKILIKFENLMKGCFFIKELNSQENKKLSKLKKLLLSKLATVKN